jgi:hypothetical protein
MEAIKQKNAKNEENLKVNEKLKVNENIKRTKPLDEELNKRIYRK